jgi:hypothetical protein
MEKKLTNSGPLREPADKHSIYAINMKIVFDDYLPKWNYRAVPEGV